MIQEPTPGRHAGTEPVAPGSYPAPREAEAGPPLPATPAGPTRTTPPMAPQAPPQGVKRHSRIGGLWVGLIIATVILVLLLVFILQNSQSVRIDFFGWAGHAPLAVAILLGGAAGALLVAVPGSVRILQLRRTAKQERTNHPV